jgi:hypothetical protein
MAQWNDRMKFKCPWERQRDERFGFLAMRLGSIFKFQAILSDIGGFTPAIDHLNLFGFNLMPSLSQIINP